MSPYILYPFALMIAYISYKHPMLEEAVILGLIVGYFLQIARSVIYHRYYAHHQFDVSVFWRYLFAGIALIFNFGSPIWNSAVHITHHAHSDTAKDPHPVKLKGLFSMDIDHRKVEYTQQLRWLVKLPEVKFIHRMHYAVPALTLIAIVLLGGEKWVIAYMTALTCSDLMKHIFSVYLSHKWGYQNFETGDHSKNTWYTAMFIGSEPWHNNHHQYPHRSNTRVKWWELDLIYWIIKLIANKETIKS